MLDLSWKDLCSFTCTAVGSLGEFLALFHFCISAKNQDLSTNCSIISLLYRMVDFPKDAKQELIKIQGGVLTTK